MLRRFVFVFSLMASLLAGRTFASAADDAGFAEPGDRPARGPAIREHGGRRSRGASTASGAMMIVILVGAMGYYVVNRLRR
ncbi:hypothetical protein AKJ09_07292 [Labilithrix luteola]|uniref:Uncharacterized protein n=1 Tax=Labilithrix luteola TaxID=1391654 RepID=A0A0K1Q4G0_9BACT|nr:hypothetical protein [Labilithrix luteola]AKV00629.1 hypothetical protein AKJ09_07292 [Labilithrix luteola]